MELLNTQHKPERRTVRRIILDLRDLLKIIKKEHPNAPQETVDYLLYIKRVEFEKAHRIVSPDYAAFGDKLYYQDVYKEPCPARDLSPLSRGIFLFERQLRESGVYKYDFIDIDPPQYYSLSGYLSGQMAWAGKILRSEETGQLFNVLRRKYKFVEENPFAGKKDAELYSIINDYAEKLAINKHGVATSDYIGPPATGGRLQLRFLPTGTTCWERSAEQRRYVAENTPEGALSLHTFQIAEMVAKRWSDDQQLFATVARPNSKWAGTLDYYSCEYYIPLIHFAILIMFEVVRKSSGHIILWICDDRIWRTSLGLVKLGKYLSNWQITMVFEDRKFITPRCFEATSYFPRQDVMLAQYLYFLYGHRVYRQGKSVSLPPFMERGEMQANFDQVHKELLEKYISMYEKYSEMLSRCHVKPPQGEELSELIESTYLELCKRVEMFQKGNSTAVILLAAPGTGKSTTISEYESRGYYPIVPDDIERTTPYRGKVLAELVDEMRNQLNADFAQINPPPTLAGLHELMRYNLWLRARGCKNVSREFAKAAVSRFIENHLAYPQNIVVECTGSALVLPKNFDAMPNSIIEYLHVNVETNYSQHLRRTKQEYRVSDYYQVIEAVAKTAEKFKYFYKLPQFAGRCILRHFNPDGSEVRLPGGDKSKIIFNPLLEPEFSALLEIM